MMHREVKRGGSKRQVSKNEITVPTSFAAMVGKIWLLDDGVSRGEPRIGRSV